MKRLSLCLVGLGILAVLVGAATADMKVELGIPTLIDGVFLAVIGFVLFSVGVLILAEKG